MRTIKRLFALGLALLLWAGCAYAGDFTTVSELRQQAAGGWERGEVLIPEVEKVPVFVVRSGDAEDPLRLTVGVFDEAQSGAFVQAVRYGKQPSHTALAGGLTLEEAQAALNGELQRLVGKSTEDYGLIWTEIAQWQNMETWLLYYGQKFYGLTSFSHGLTMDARTQDYHHLIIPHAQAQEILLDDVPLLSWPAVRESVEAYLDERRQCTPESLELGYLMPRADSVGMLVPVWHLGLTMPGGFEEVYFSAQTGEEILWKGNAYLLPEPFGWEAVR